MSGEYAFIITIQYANPNGVGVDTSTYSGGFKTSPGMTRRAALADVITETRKQYGIAKNAPISILFFSFEPNRLDGA